jgi:hypothetical protein
MTTNKLYSGKFLIIKAVFAVLLPALTELAGVLFDAENALVFLFFSMFFMGLFYAVPFMLTLLGIRREESDKKEVRRFILYDFAIMLFPVIISTVVTESVFAIFNSDAHGLGFFSVLSIVILTLITLAFWLTYIVFRKKQ